MSWEDPPLAKRQRLDDIGSSMFHHLLETGEHTDVTDMTFLVGSAHQIHIKAHKIVLIGRSEVFAKTFNPLWTTTGDRVRLPPDIGEQAARAFVKFIYTKDLSTSTNSKSTLSTKTLFDLIYLGDCYLIPFLPLLCADLLLPKISSENCAEIFEKARLFDHLPGVKLVQEKAMECIKTNFATLRAFGSCKHWNFDTWECLLNQNYFVVKEISLFKGILSWRDWRVKGIKRYFGESAEQFRKLLRLIRFPIMELCVFDSIVVPAGVLSLKEKTKLRAYIAQNDQNPSQSPSRDLGFNSESRRRKFVKNSKELKTACDSVISGDIIQIQSGVYKGPFSIKADQVRLEPLPCSEGIENKKPVLEGNFPLTLRGNQCSVSHIRFQFLQGAIFVQGNSNKFSDIELQNLQPAYKYVWEESFGFKIFGDENHLDQILTQGKGCKVLIKGSENKVTASVFTEADSAIRIYGSENILKNLSFFGVQCDEDESDGDWHHTDWHEDEEHFYIDQYEAIAIPRGFGNRVEQVKVELGDKGVALIFGFGSMSAVVNGFEKGSVHMSGRDHTLFNVDAETITIFGGRGYRLIDCKAEDFDIEFYEDDGDIFISGCNFSV